MRDRFKRAWVFMLHKFANEIVAERRFKGEFELAVAHKTARRGEGVEIVDAFGDFAGAAVAMSHLTANPLGIGESHTERSGDFIPQQSGAWRIRVDCVDVEEVRIAAEKGVSGGKSAFKIGESGSRQDVDFRHIAHMDVEVRAGDPRLEARMRGRADAVAGQRVASGIEKDARELVAIAPEIGRDRGANAKPVAARGSAKYATEIVRASERIEGVIFIKRRDGADRIVEKGDQTGKHIAK
jgi:hypothetical protein